MTPQDPSDRVTKLVICPTHLRISMSDRHTDLVGQYKKMSVKSLLILSVEIIFNFDGFANGQINKS